MSHFFYALHAVFREKLLENYDTIQMALKLSPGAMCEFYVFSNFE